MRPDHPRPRLEEVGRMKKSLVVIILVVLGIMFMTFELTAQKLDVCGNKGYVKLFQIHFPLFKPSQCYDPPGLGYEPRE